MMLVLVPKSFAVSTWTDNHRPQPSHNALAALLGVRAHEKSAGSDAHQATIQAPCDSRGVLLTYAIANRSTRSIRGVRGILSIRNYFGSPVHRVAVSETIDLEPGQEVFRQGCFHRSDFKDEESFEAFRTTPLARLHQEWVPEELVLADGTALKP